MRMDVNRYEDVDLLGELVLQNGIGTGQKQIPEMTVVDDWRQEHCVGFNRVTYSGVAMDLEAMA